MGSLDQLTDPAAVLKFGWGGAQGLGGPATEPIRARRSACLPSACGPSKGVFQDSCRQIEKLVDGGAKCDILKGLCCFPSLHTIEKEVAAVSMRMLAIVVVVSLSLTIPSVCGQETPRQVGMPVMIKFAEHAPAGGHQGCQ